MIGDAFPELPVTSVNALPMTPSFAARLAASAALAPVYMSAHLPLIFADVAGSRVAFAASSARTCVSIKAAVSGDAFLPRSVFAQSRISSCLRSSRDRDSGASEAEEPTRGLGTARILEGESRPGVVARGARPGVANGVTHEGIVASTGVTQCRATPTDGRASFLGELERCDFVVGTSVFEFSSDGSGKERLVSSVSASPGGTETRFEGRRVHT